MLPRIFRKIITEVTSSFHSWTINFEDTVRYESDVPKQVRLQELMPVAMNVASLPSIMKAAGLFEFDINRFLLEVEAQVKA